VDAERDARWRVALAPYYRELGLEQDSTPGAGARIAFSTEAAALLADFKQ
jgi:nitronate monooxygenase